MLRSESIMSLQQMRKEGKSVRGISRETGLSRNTVRRYLRAQGIPERKARKKRGSKLDPFQEEIQEMMRLGIFNCEVIYGKLKELGYQGGKTIIKDYVKAFRPPRGIVATCRYETKPGKQVQVDWGVCYYVDEKDGTPHKVYVLVMVLGYSRAIYLEFAYHCNIRSFLRGLLHGFSYFGGVTDIVLSDQMKTVILGWDERRKPKWHPLFLDLALTLGFTPQVCKARRPQTKGKVERGVGYVKSNFFPGRKFQDRGDLNRQAYLWCEEKNQRLHGTTGQKPQDLLLQENLKPLPPVESYQQYLTERRKVSKDGFLSYQGVRYGVPWIYSGRELSVREEKEEIEILWQDKVVATHERSYQVGTYCWLENQYQGLGEKEGKTYPSPQAWKLKAEEVEKRPLSVYEQWGGKVTW